MRTAKRGEKRKESSPARSQRVIIASVRSPTYHRDMSAAEHEDDLVTLVVPSEVAAAVKARVESGEYASQGDVVRNGLRLLTEEDALLNDPDVERWLREVAVPIAEATLADPSRSIPADEVRAHFTARRAARA